jgi:prepilin-type N-terminal cleavage/methylation domain-containing protein
MSQRNSGFSMLELLVVVLVMGIIVAMAIPQAINAVKAYRLHSDAGAVAAQLNVTRFRATSQNAPYRLNIDVSTTPHSYTMERLCGSTPTSVDSNCTSPYAEFSIPQLEGGSQYLSIGDYFTTSNPGGSTNPGTLTSGAGATVFYFNTRGMPVTSAGAPLPNGGSVIYVTNRANLIDGVVLTVGGRITVYQWNPSSSAWMSR